MLKEFKGFLARGSVIDLAVGVIIGAAFGAIVNSLVKDIVMPPLGLALGEIDFSNFHIILKHGLTPGPYSSLSAAQAAGAVSLNYGNFVSTIINFLIVAFAVFFFIVKPLAKLQSSKEAPGSTLSATKECPFCFTDIPAKASRCPNCTSQLVKQL